MGKNKALVGAGVLVALGVVVAIVANRVIGLVAIVAGLALGFVALRQRSAQGNGFLALDDEEDIDTRAGFRTTTLAEPQGLPTWEPEPLATWSPPEDVLVTEAEELPSFEEYESLRSAQVLEEDEALLTEIEVELEEPAPAKPASLFSAPAPIREIEDVHSDEDILKASAATSLNVTPSSGGNTELAKLLAKVQSRLAAYE